MKLLTLFILFILKFSLASANTNGADLDTSLPNCHSLHHNNLVVGLMALEGRYRDQAGVKYTFRSFVDRSRLAYCDVGFQIEIQKKGTSAYRFTNCLVDIRNGANIGSSNIQCQALSLLNQRPVRITSRSLRLEERPYVIEGDGETYFVPVFNLVQIGNKQLTRIRNF